MWRLIAARHTSQDRGATTVVVVILLSVFLLGLGAIAVDAGSWYAEKAQVQNGADAGALAVAQSCAEGRCDISLAGPQASANSNGANDTSAKVVKVCGNSPGADSPLSPCAFDSVETVVCPALSNDDGAYVYVHTVTLNTKTGTTLVPPLMGKLLLKGSYDGKSVHACARVAWSPAAGGQGLALTFSFCNWDAATNPDFPTEIPDDQRVFAPAPPYSNWPPAGVAPYTATVPAPGAPGGEQVLQLHGSGNDCVGGPGGSGWQLPGGFGWLDDPNGDCTAYVDDNNIYDDRTGVPVKEECVNALEQSYRNHTRIYIPVYDGFAGTVDKKTGGSNGSYHLAGFAAFVVTGGHLNGQHSGFDETSNIPGGRDSGKYCKGTQRCIYGFFTQGLVPSGTFDQDALPGVTTVYMTG